MVCKSSKLLLFVFKNLLKFILDLVFLPKLFLLTLYLLEFLLSNGNVDFEFLTKVILDLLFINSFFKPYILGVLLLRAPGLLIWEGVLAL